MSPYWVRTEMQFAIAHGVRGFVAEVLQANNAMLNLAKRLGKIEIRSEESVSAASQL